MKLSLEQGRNGRVRVRIEGNLDMDTVPEARKRLLRIVGAKGRSSFEVDFSGIASMDTSGVAMLVEIYRSLSETGRTLCLSGLREDQQRLFSLARLNQAFGLCSEDCESS